MLPGAIMPKEFQEIAPANFGLQLDEIIGLDEARAHSVRNQAQSKLPASEVQVNGANGMVGGRIIEEQEQLQRKHQKALEELEARPFIEMVQAIADDGEVAAYYRTRLDSVDVQVDPDERSTLVSWTHPLPSKMIGRKPGDRVTFNLAAGRQQQWIFRARAVFSGGLFPIIETADYIGSFGEVSFTSVDERAERIRLLSEGLIEALRPRAPDKAERDRRRQHTPTPEFGLGEIIELADRPQRGAMQLPYDRHVLIEGPPGSGKSSVALMRVAVLIQEQFEPLGIDRDREASWQYHERKTRVLVRHDTMIPYLQSGLAKIGQEHVPVETVRDFLWSRAGGLAAGSERADSPQLARLKALPNTTDLVWDGFRRQLDRNMAELGIMFLANLRELGRPGELALRELDAWHKAVAGATLTRDKDGRPALPDAVNFARRARVVAAGITKLRQWAALHAVGTDADVVTRQCDQTVEVFRMFATEVVPKVNRLAALFEGPELLLHAVQAAAIENGIDGDTYAAAMTEWREQMTAPASGRSEADVALAACLASAMATVTSTGGDVGGWPAVAVGVETEVITHMVLDEAQDLTPMEALAIRSWCSKDAVVTAVGDLRQCVSVGRGLRSWTELGLPRVRRAVFADNYRQTWEIGRFVRHLHERLFGEEPVWRASTKRYGPKPRIRVLRGESPDAASAAAEEVAWMRQQVAKATIAVIVDDSLPRRLLDNLYSELIDAVDSLGVEVDVAATHDDKQGIHRRDSVILLPVSETKGIEFDGVVILGNASTWTRRLGPVDAGTNGLPEEQRVARNCLYVAASRAQHFLSIITRGSPKILKPLMTRRLCELQHR